MSAARNVSSAGNGSTPSVQQAVSQEVSSHVELLRRIGAEREEHKAVPLTSNHTVAHLDPILRTLSPAIGPQEYGIFCGSPPKDLETLTESQRKGFPVACVAYSFYYLWKALKLGFNLKAESANGFIDAIAHKAFVYAKNIDPGVDDGFQVFDHLPLAGARYFSLNYPSYLKPGEITGLIWEKEAGGELFTCFMLLDARVREMPVGYLGYEEKRNGQSVPAICATAPENIFLFLQIKIGERKGPTLFLMPRRLKEEE